MRLTLLFAGLGILSSAGCNRDPVFREMSDSTYVRTMIALRRLPIGLADTTQRVRQRDSILQAMGVTATELEAIAIRLADYPVKAGEIFRAIENPGAPGPP